VRLKGESGEGTGDADSFLTKKGWQKFIILAAGVCMNWVLAMFIFTIGFAVGVPAEIDALPPSAIVSNQHIEIVEVVSKSAAQNAGLQQAIRSSRLMDRFRIMQKLRVRCWPIKQKKDLN
jgi:membrane-associated protease RseP (regulator of RpoE activity)